MAVVEFVDTYQTICSGEERQHVGEDQVQRGSRVNWIGTEFSAGLARLA